MSWQFFYHLMLAFVNRHFFKNIYIFSQLIIIFFSNITRGRARVTHICNFIFALHDVYKWIPYDFFSPSSFIFLWHLQKERKQSRDGRMTYRIITVCVIAVLLLSFTVTYASRPEPPFDDVTPMDNLYWVR